MSTMGELITILIVSWDKQEKRSSISCDDPLFNQSNGWRVTDKDIEPLEVKNFLETTKYRAS